MARVIWTERALRDLEELLTYLETQSPALARRYAAAIVARVDQLESFPHSGGSLEEDPGGVYRQLIQGSHRIIYRVDGDEVYVVATHHTARLLDVRDLSSS